MLETAQTRDDVLLSCHDGYRTLDNPIKNDDPHLALGHGMALIYRDAIHVCRIFAPANTDRLLIARVQLSPLYSFILVAFHADPHFLSEALAHLEHVLRMLRTRYQDADFVVFSDLNIEQESGKGRKFFGDLESGPWIVPA